MAKKDKYLEKIHSLFLEKGVKGFTMEDIAESISITKMTLYNNFKDKETLLEEIMLFRAKKYSYFRNSKPDKNDNAITMLIDVLKFQSSNSLQSSRTFYVSIKECYPKIYNAYQEQFKHGIAMFIKGNIMQGVKEGLYREGVSADNITSYILASMDGVFSGWVSDNSTIDLNFIHKQLIDYHIRGIANDKGVKILEEELKKLKQENNDKL